MNLQKAILTSIVAYTFINSASAEEALNVTVPWVMMEPANKAGATLNCAIIDENCATLDSQSKSIRQEGSNGATTFSFQGAIRDRIAGVQCRLVSNGRSLVTTKVLKGSAQNCAVGGSSRIAEQPRSDADRFGKQSEARSNSIIVDTLQLNNAAGISTATLERDSLTQKSKDLQSEVDGSGVKLPDGATIKAGKDIAHTGVPGIPGKTDGTITNVPTGGATPGATGLPNGAKLPTGKGGLDKPNAPGTGLIAGVPGEMPGGSGTVSSTDTGAAGGFVDDVAGTIKGVGSAVKSTVGDAADSVSSLRKREIETGKKPPKASKSGKPGTGSSGNILNDIVSGVSSGISSAADGVKNTAVGAYNNAADAVKKTTDAVKKAAGGGTDKPGSEKKPGDKGRPSDDDLAAHLRKTGDPAGDPSTGAATTRLDDLIGDKDLTDLTRKEKKSDKSTERPKSKKAGDAEPGTPGVTPTSSGSSGDAGQPAGRNQDGGHPAGGKTAGTNTGTTSPTTSNGSTTSGTQAGETEVAKKTPEEGDDGPSEPADLPSPRELFGDGKDDNAKKVKTDKKDNKKKDSKSSDSGIFDAVGNFFTSLISGNFMSPEEVIEQKIREEEEEKNRIEKENEEAERKRREDEEYKKRKAEKEEGCRDGTWDDKEDPCDDGGIDSTDTAARCNPDDPSCRETTTVKGLPKIGIAAKSGSALLKDAAKACGPNMRPMPGGGCEPVEQIANPVAAEKKICQKWSQIGGKCEKWGPSNVRIEPRNDGVTDPRVDPNNPHGK